METEEIKKLKEEHLRRIEELESSEHFLHYDFQGWPVFKKTLRELLLELGAKEENGVIGFNVDNTILNTYPETMEDDGMAYGVGEMFFTLANIAEDKNGNKCARFWRDTKWNKNIKEENE